MTGQKLDELFAATIAPKQRSWGRIITVLKRQFNSWASEKLLEQGYPDVKMAHVSLLMNITPDGITNKELSAKALMSKQAMSKVVRELYAKGYISTIPQGEDKRCTGIFLTDKGKKLAIVFRRQMVQLEAAYQEKFGFPRMESIKDMLLELIAFNSEKFPAK